MGLVKLKNNGNAILFIDSISMTIRPGEIRLFDENAAKNDAQLMKCVFTGILEMCGMEEKLESESREEKKKAEEKVSEEEAKTKKNVLDNKKTNGETDDGVVEPKNTKPVVMFGRQPSRMSTIKNSDLKMPDYINPDDIIGVDENSTEAGDIRPDDILYVDESDDERQFDAMMEI